MSVQPCQDSLTKTCSISASFYQRPPGNRAAICSIMSNSTVSEDCWALHCYLLSNPSDDLWRPDNLWSNTIKENTKHYFLHISRRRKSLIRGNNLEDISLAFKLITKLIDLMLIKNSLIIFTYIVLNIKKYVDNFQQLAMLFTLTVFCHCFPKDFISFPPKYPSLGQMFHGFFLLLLAVCNMHIQERQHKGDNTLILWK